jgi:hypothetical protein
MQEKKIKLFVYLNSPNAEWLDMTVASLKRDRQRTNRSELIDLAITLLKKKPATRLGKILKNTSV